MKLSAAQEGPNEKKFQFQCPGIGLFVLWSIYSYRSVNILEAFKENKKKTF